MSDHHTAFRHAAEDAASRVPGTVLVTLAGSHAYGTDRPGSDLDIMGVYVAPLREILSHAVHERAERMLVDLDTATATSPLPDEPDHERITDLICRLRGVA